MKKQLIKLTEGDLHRIVRNTANKILRESFEDDFNSARDKYFSGKPNGMFGFEMKDSEGEWQYGDVTYDPNTNTMSCMGVSIEVDPDLSIDQNLEGLYEELVNNGYSNGDDENDEDLDAYAEDRMDLEANYDDFPPTRNESIIRRAVKESINRILREDEEPYDWRSDFHLYHDSLNMKPEEGTALHDKYMKGAKEEFGDDELARIREFNRMWKERERRRGIESDSDDNDFDDENEIKKALQRANYMKKMGPTKKQTYQKPQTPQTQRSLSDDEFQARLKDLQAQGVLK